MKSLRSKWPLLLVLFLFSACSSAPTYAEAPRSLKGPPADAAVSANHGSFFFVYPQEVGARYTGCQTMWDELGRPVFVFRFMQGTLMKYSLADYSGGSKLKVCKYEHENLTHLSSKGCASYVDVTLWFLTWAPRE